MTLLEWFLPGWASGTSCKPCKLVDHLKLRGQHVRIAYKSRTYATMEERVFVDRRLEIRVNSTVGPQHLQGIYVADTFRIFTELISSAPDC